jgi:hypothetical protein
MQISPAGRRFTVEPGSARHRSLTRLRKWERNRGTWDKDRRLSGIGGRRLVRLAAAGHARPYALGELRRDLRGVVSGPAVDLAEWFLAAQYGFKARVLVARQAELGELVGVSVRTAAGAARQLVALGLLEQRPHFRRLSGGGHAELEHSYRATRRLRDLVAAGRRRHGSGSSPSGAKRPVARATPSVRVEDPASPSVGRNCRPRVRASDRAGDEATIGAAQALAVLETKLGAARRAIVLRAEVLQAELGELETQAAARRAAQQAAAPPDDTPPDRCPWSGALVGSAHVCAACEDRYHALRGAH